MLSSPSGNCAGSSSEAEASPANPMSQSPCSSQGRAWSLHGLQACRVFCSRQVRSLLPVCVFRGCRALLWQASFTDFPASLHHVACVPGTGGPVFGSERMPGGAPIEGLFPRRMIKGLFSRSFARLMCGKGPCTITGEGAECSVETQHQNALRC